MYGVSSTGKESIALAIEKMFDSLAYRNDASTVFRRLIRSLPTRKGVIGVATCDKGLPAMMMALAAMHDLPCVLIPGGVTLPPSTTPAVRL